ncbi:MAG: hypothetical protein HQK76_12310 [Desulfobacterales bacterium]|nr:hypothetical protein [Desulfobacterales bacterium]
MDYPANMYLYDPVNDTFDIIKENCNDANGGTLSADLTKIVYAERVNSGEPRTVKIYNVSSKQTNEIPNIVVKGNAVFDSNGYILYIDDNDKILKKTDLTGSNINTISNPQSPFAAFDIIWMSPNHQKLLIVERRSACQDGYLLCNHERLIMIDSDGTNRTIIKEAFLGEWNMVVWSSNSTKFIYYHHIFMNEQKIPQYISVDLSSGNPIITDLSETDLGIDENLLIYTRIGNLLSLSYQLLYNGMTGKYIANRSMDVPLLTQGLWGYPCDYIMDPSKYDIYFADTDKTNVRKFIEYRNFPWILFLLE